MAKDLLRVQSNERIDLADFQALADELLVDNIRDVIANAWTDPNKTRLWILDGFTTAEVDTPERVSVTRGRAICGYRSNGTIKYGMLVSSGEDTIEVDVSTFPDNTYGVYIRFEYPNADIGSRVFWDPSGSGDEFGQAVYTRKEANWSARVESTTPGGEWQLISEFDLTSGEIGTITDKRNLYFEGVPDDSYESGWSSEGGGTANDRNADRSTYGVKDLQTFTAAVRQCLEDLKGRGLRRWWEKGIGGLNVGFDDDPTEDKMAVESSDFAMQVVGGIRQLLFGDTTGGNWRFEFDPSAGTKLLKLLVDGTTRLIVNTNGTFNVDTSDNSSDAVLGSAGTGIGVNGVSANGFGVEAKGSQGSAPPKSSLHIFTQKDDPATKTKGSIYTHEDTGRMAMSNGTGFERVIGQMPHAFTFVQDDDRTTTLGQFTTKITVPANSLREGSVIHVVSGGRATSLGGSQYTVNARFGSTQIASVSSSSSLAAVFWMIEWWAVVEDAGGGNFFLSQQMWHTLDSQDGTDLGSTEDLSTPYAYNTSHDINFTGIALGGTVYLERILADIS